MQGGTWDSKVLEQTLREISLSYRAYNRELFEGRLRMPVLEWTTNSAELGAYLAGLRTLRLSVSLLEAPWGTLLEVLKHEMAHQYVHEVEGVQCETAHGDSFRRVCRERGIDARAHGVPAPSSDAFDPQRMRQARVAKLLALAESDNPHEAQAAMAAARRLMLKYNIEDSRSGVAFEYGFRHLGAPTGRRGAWQRMLAAILQDHFFVEVIVVPVYLPVVGRGASVLEICGTIENLDIAEYVHAFLERTALGLWHAHRRGGASRGTNAARQSFLYGVLSGFHDKLERDARAHEQQGLVWVGDPALQEFFQRRHPRVRRVGFGTRVDRRAYDAGHEEGRRIVLHRGVQASSSVGTPARLVGKTDPAARIRKG